MCVWPSDVQHCFLTGIVTVMTYEVGRSDELEEYEAEEFRRKTVDTTVRIEGLHDVLGARLQGFVYVIQLG